MKKLSLVLIFSFVLGQNFVFLSSVQADPADHLVINEVHLASQDSTYDDWIEIYNPTAFDVDVSTWSIQKTNATGGSFYRKALSGVVEAGGYLLIVRDHIETSQDLKDTADVLAAGSSFSLSSDNVFYLVDDNEDILDSSDPNIVDYLGLGSALVYEGTGTAPNPLDGESVSRSPDGEESDDNSLDFVIQSSPSPKGITEASQDLFGTVLLTINPDAQVVQNLGPSGAEIVFFVNADADAKVYYGLDDTYGSETLSSSVLAGQEERVALDGLSCGTIYHYSIYAETSDQSESDQSLDSTFETMPCGIRLDSLTMTKSNSRANNDYSDGWEWEFVVTIWDETESSLKMKFAEWTGASTLEAADNMRYSADSIDWITINANDTYSESGIDISAIDEDETAPGRQVFLIIQMKVPVGTLAGDYGSFYGILTE